MGRQRALKAQNEGLKTALSASDRVANDSLDIALTRTLLNIGSFLHELRNAQTSASSRFTLWSAQNCAARLSDEIVV